MSGVAAHALTRAKDKTPVAANRTVTGVVVFSSALGICFFSVTAWSMFCNQKSPWNIPPVRDVPIGLTGRITTRNYASIAGQNICQHTSYCDAETPSTRSRQTPAAVQL